MCILNYKYGFIQYSEDHIIKFKAIQSIKISFQKIIHKIWIKFFYFIRIFNSNFNFI